MVTEVFVEALQKRRYRVSRVKVVFEKLFKILEKVASKRHFKRFKHNFKKSMKWMTSKPENFHQTIEEIYLSLINALPLTESNGMILFGGIEIYQASIQAGNQQTWVMKPNHLYISGDPMEAERRKIQLEYIKDTITYLYK